METAQEVTGITMLHVMLQVNRVTVAKWLDHLPFTSKVAVRFSVRPTRADQSPVLI